MNVGHYQGKIGNQEEGRNEDRTGKEVQLSDKEGHKEKRK